MGGWGVSFVFFGPFWAIFVNFGLFFHFGAFFIFGWSGGLEGGSEGLGVFTEGV